MIKCEWVSLSSMVLSTHLAESPLCAALRRRDFRIALLDLVFSWSVADELCRDQPEAPAGWKSFTPKDNAFTVFIPEKTTRQSERERTSTVRGRPMKLTALRVEAGGLVYMVERLTIPTRVGGAVTREQGRTEERATFRICAI